MGVARTYIGHLVGGGARGAVNLMPGKIVSAGRADLSESVGTESVAAVGADLMVGKLSMMPSGVVMVIKG